MAEYIDRAAIYEKLNDLPHEYRNAEQRARTGGIAACKEIVRYFPAANVVERKKGLWALVEKRRKASVYRCSECGNFFTVWPDTLNCGRGDMNYCPNCGADMREQEPKTEPAPETYDLLREEGGWNLQ